MKKLTGIVLFLMLFVGTVHAQDWYTAGAIVNPVANTIMADSGAAPTEQMLAFKVICASTIAAVLVLEWRDSTNTTNKYYQYLPVAANTPLQVNLDWPVFMTTGERFRIRINAAVTGSTQCTILAQ